MNTDGRSSGERVRRNRQHHQPTLWWSLAIVCLVIALSPGCSQFRYRLANNEPPTYVPNPLELPPAEDAFVWSQVVDAVDDYFRIAREQPVQNREGLVLDGRIETAYRPGASLFEPWRKDSTSGFERLQSTLQSIRRRAIVIVRPYGAAYQIEVIVQKDLEDTDRSQFATERSVGGTKRHDGTIVRTQDQSDDNPTTLGWIPLGRDATLEQAILRDIVGRLTQPDQPRLLHGH